MVARAAALCLHFDVSLILFRELLSIKFIALLHANLYSCLPNIDLPYATDAS